MDKVEKRLSSLKVLNSRKSLGPRPTHLYKNALSKISTEERKNIIQGYTFKHLNDLLNVNHSGFSPSNLLFVFKTLEKNAYFNKTLILSIHKAILEKIIYFSPSQIIDLLDCMDNLPTLSFFGIGIKDCGEPQGTTFISILPSHDSCSKNGISELIGSTYLAEIETLRSKIISKIIDRYTDENHTEVADFKNKKQLIIWVKCLHNMIKSDPLRKMNWEAAYLLSSNILNTLSMLLGENTECCDTFMVVLVNYTNIMADLLSLKTIEEIINMLTFISSDSVFKETFDSDVLLTNEIITYPNNNFKSLYSNGDVQILKFLVDHSLKPIGKCRSIELYFSHKNVCIINGMILLYNRLATLVCNVLSSFPPEKSTQLSDTILGLNFKIINIGRYLSHVYSNCSNLNEVVRNRIIELSTQFISFLYNHETEKFYDSISAIISISVICRNSACKHANRNISNYGLAHMSADILRRSYSLMQSNLNKFSNLDILNILEGLTQTLNYIHQSIFRLLLDFSFSKPPNTQFDVLIFLKLYQISSKIPYKYLQNKIFSCNILKSSRLHFEIHDSEHYKKIINRINNKINTTSKPGSYVCQFDSKES